MPIKTERGVGGWGGEVKRERGVVDKEKKEERDGRASIII